MNVTGVEWRGHDPREDPSAGTRKRRTRKPIDPTEDQPETELEGDEDIVVFHTEQIEESADEVDLAESQRSE